MISYNFKSEDVKAYGTFKDVQMSSVPSVFAIEKLFYMRYREREVVVNENEYFGIGEPEPNILISASAPRLTEDLNAQLLDVGGN